VPAIVDVDIMSECSPPWAGVARRPDGAS